MSHMTFLQHMPLACDDSTADSNHVGIGHRFLEHLTCRSTKKDDSLLRLLSFMVIVLEYIEK